MQNKPTPAKGTSSELTTDKSASCGADCSALEFLAKELEMPADHLREIGRAMRDDKIAEAADKLHQAFYTMKHDWKSGDFELPRLAEIHMAAIESKALDLGKLLFRRQNANVEARQK